MSAKFAEVTLGQHYREVRPDESNHGWRHVLLLEALKRNGWLGQGACGFLRHSHFGHS